MSGYPSATIGDPGFALVVSGQSPSSSTYNEVGAGLPFYQGKSDFGLVSPTPRVWCSEGVRFAEAGDTLVSVRAPVGDVNVAKERSVIGRGIAAVRATGDTDPWFLFFALLDAKGTLAAQATGSTFASVNRSALEGLEVPRPTGAVQRQIADVLRVVLSGVEHETGLLDATETLKRAVMQELFTRGLRGGEPQDSEIGLIPTDWEVSPMGSLGKIGNGSTPKRNNSAYWEGGTFPWLTSAKVYDREITSADQFVTDTALQECHLPKVDPGAVLMAITGQGKTLGHVAVLEVPASVSQHVAYIQTDLDKVVPGFLRGYLETQYDYLRQVASGGGSTKGALTCAFLRDLPIPMPSTLEKQQEIVDILDALDEKVALHRQKRALYEELFQALLHGLMTQDISVDDLDLTVLPEHEAVPA